MTLQDIQLGASQNLLKTYFSLGMALPYTTLHHEEGFNACLGEFEHPICNFAAGLNLDPTSARKLGALAANKRAFNVYVLPGDQPFHLRELLERAGFRVSYRLVQMIAEPANECTSCPVRLALTAAKRIEIAQFMTEQFFSRQTEGFRERVAQATADATNLELYELAEFGRITGAFMLCHDDQVVGLYNLCVLSANRGLGLGKALTGWVLMQAKESGKLVTLQCDVGLQAWYTSQGFRPTGTVDVYTLSKSNRSDIMNNI